METELEKSLLWMGECGWVRKERERKSEWLGAEKK
jgi:hypothetical protein